ncbi:hypothetical protein B0H16DRAFT_863289 [Mycena metata]|uniref:Uncharacterized protein n=1 Tax=Mycena metata TaxID=1033252 RepID=A0AAD7IT34_9AGAR|nr:hypothetical protein B0H16DRAFT_863289 [Mycena metata]
MVVVPDLNFSFSSRHSMRMSHSLLTWKNAALPVNKFIKSCHNFALAAFVDVHSPPRTVTTPDDEEASCSSLAGTRSSSALYSVLTTCAIERSCSISGRRRESSIITLCRIQHGRTPPAYRAPRPNARTNVAVVIHDGKFRRWKPPAESAALHDGLAQRRRADTKYRVRNIRDLRLDLLDNTQARQSFLGSFLTDRMYISTPCSPCRHPQLHTDQFKSIILPRLGAISDVIRQLVVSVRDPSTGCES